MSAHETLSLLHRMAIMLAENALSDRDRATTERAIKALESYARREQQLVDALAAMTEIARDG